MSKLYVVATPIGNLKDITLRALEVFKSVDLIVCEDTRVTSKLLSHYQIKKPLVSYHQQSKVNQVNRVIELIKQGKDLVLVTDAGTPGIQDPGGKLIREIGQIGDLKIIPVPGASAVTALLSISGLPADSFLFLGFLPKKKGRSKSLSEIVNSKRTVICFESGQRILKTLEALRQAQGDNLHKQIVIGRELTKKFEAIYRGTIKEVVNQIKKDFPGGKPKGEFVIAF